MAGFFFHLFPSSSLVFPNCNLICSSQKFLKSPHSYSAKPFHPFPSSIASNSSFSVFSSSSFLSLSSTRPSLRRSTPSPKRPLSRPHLHFSSIRRRPHFLKPPFTSPYEPPLPQCCQVGLGLSITIYVPRYSDILPGLDLSHEPRSESGFAKLKPSLSSSRI